MPLFLFIAAAQASPGYRGSKGSFLVKEKEMKAREGQGFMSENLALSKGEANAASKGEQENAERE